MINPGETHEEKYERLAQRIGVDALRRILPSSPERIRAALAAGDEHLNTITLASWDRAAGLLNPYRVHAEHCRLSFMPPWRTEVAAGLSLAERVCVLKHVARFHLEVK